MLWCNLRPTIIEALPSSMDNKNISDLATQEAHLETLRNGGTVENLTIAGAKLNIAGLKACIAHSRKSAKTINFGEGS